MILHHAMDLTLCDSDTGMEKKSGKEWLTRCRWPLHEGEPPLCPWTYSLCCPSEITRVMAGPQMPPKPPDEQERQSCTGVWNLLLSPTTTLLMTPNSASTTWLLKSSRYGGHSPVPQVLAVRVRGERWVAGGVAVGGNPEFQHPQDSCLVEETPSEPV